MVEVSERFGLDPERTWVAVVLAAVAALVGGTLLAPKLVYERFIWKYFWGPVYADAHGVSCAWLENGAPVTSRAAGGTCADVATLARPGYTLVSEVGYAVVGLTAVVGIAFLLRRLDLRRYRTLFFAVFPFMVFGGALRVVEDVNDAAFRESLAAGDPRWILEYPLNTLFISPVIYVTVFAVALAALVGSLYLDRRGYVDGFEYPLAAVGTVAVALTLGVLVFMSASTPFVTFHAAVLLVTLALAGLATALTWVGIERFAPGMNAGTGAMGLFVLIGQAVDGAANVIGLDWYTTLVPSATRNLSPKHPVNAAVDSITRSVLPESVTDAIGSVWPFLLIKLAAAVFILWIFDEDVIEDSPQFTVMLLIGAVAVGLGPGTRDMLRATFGV
jgi:uncharacterized membrane protein